jgi:hypothetical protein
MWDVLNHDSVLFINLTDVVVNETEQADFIPSNKPMMESVTLRDEQPQ